MGPVVARWQSWKLDSGLWDPKSYVHTVHPTNENHLKEPEGVQRLLKERAEPLLSLSIRGACLPAP